MCMIDIFHRGVRNYQYSDILQFVILQNWIDFFILTIDMQLFMPLVHFILLWFLLLAITNVDASVWILVTWCLPDVTVALQHIAIYTVLLPRIVIHIVSPDSGGYKPLIFKQFLSREPALVLWGLKKYCTSFWIVICCTNCQSILSHIYYF